MEKRFGYKDPKVRCGEDLGARWKHTEPAYRIAPHAWNVGGQDDVSVYLLDSGEGLILIDTGYEGTLYLTIDRIWSLGFNPRDVKKILLTHYHSDHTQGARLLKEMSGAEIWLSREDEAMHQATRDAGFPMPILPYEVDRFYGEEPIRLGRFSIRTRLTPGHTVGSTSLFFEDTDEATGRTFLCAVHGGLGTGPMVPGSDWMRREGGTTERCMRFVADCLELADLPVDINMPSHLNQANIDEHMPPDPNDYTWFVNDYSWHDMMVNRAEEVMSYYPEIYPGLVRTVPNVE